MAGFGMRAGYGDPRPAASLCSRARGCKPIVFQEGVAAEHEANGPAKTVQDGALCKPRLDCHRAVAAASCENVRFEFVAGDPLNFFTSRSKKNLRPIPRLLWITSLSAEIADMLGWWNWQTRTFEGRMPKGVRVQVPSRVPCGTTGRKAAWIEDSRGLCIGDGFEQRPGER